MYNKKNIRLLSFLAPLMILSLIIGATFAYFQASGKTSSNTDVKVITYTTDVLNFEVGNDISIDADQTIFASGKGNATGSTFAKAILTANNKTNTATMNYYLYLNITKNSFSYTQNGDTPELLLTITDASGTPIKDITTLTYKTVTDGKNASISGYDITNKEGLITLFDNKEITASPTKTDEWNITVTFINYNKDQSKNAGHTFSGKLMIQKKSFNTALTISESCTEGENLADCIKSTADTNKNLLFHDENTIGAKDNSYRYVGPDGIQNGITCSYNGSEFVSVSLEEEPCKKVYSVSKTIGSLMRLLNGSKGSSPFYYTDLPFDKLEKKKVVYNSEEDKCLTIDGEEVTLDSNTNVQNHCQGNSYYADGAWFIETPVYIGEGTYYGNTNNYVCFGSFEQECPNDNLYRIIGVFDNKVKLIKVNYLPDKYYYNLTTINKAFLDNLDSKWTNIIYENEWITGDRAREEININLSAVQIYQKEIVNGPNTYFKSKIGLTYLSDFLFSKEPRTYLKTSEEEDILSASWMSSLMPEEVPLMMTSTLASQINLGRFSIHVWDYTYSYQLLNNNAYYINPVFYLNTSVKYISGNGTSSNPIRILT